MTTEAKIRETFNKQFDPDSKGTHFNTFEDGYKAGYMALLNELEQCAVLVVDKEVEFRSVRMNKNVWKLSDGSHYLYALPEGAIMNIELVKYNKGIDGNLNVPASINEQETEHWRIIYDSGCGVGQSFGTKEEAMEWADSEMVTRNVANLVRIKVSVKQYGRI